MANNLRLVLVGDQSAGTEVVLHELQREGFEFDWQCVQTEAAFLGCLEPAPDIIVADYRMAQFDAERALKLLKEHALDVPCIVVSDVIGEDIAVSIMKKGAVDYLLKDHPARLGLAIRCVLEQQKLRTSLRDAEVARMARDECFRALIENSSDGIAMLDPDGNLIYASPSTTQILGYSVEEFLGLDHAELVYPDDVEFADEQFAALLAKPGNVISIEQRLRHKDGSWLWVENTGRNLLADPKIAALLFNYRNITERKQAEEELRRSEELFAKAFRASPDAFIISRLSDSVLLDVNDSFSETTGYSREEVVGRPIAELNIIWANQDDRDRMVAMLRAQGSVHNFETSYIKKSGEMGSGLISSEIVQIGSESCMLTICRDVTERKRVEVALEESLSILRATLESTADGILVADGKGAITSFNEKFVELWGIPDSVLASHNDNQALEFVLGQLRDPEAFSRKVQELYGQPDVDSLDVLEFKDGRTFERYSRPQVIGGQSVGRVWSFRDVTERNQAAKAQGESERKYRALIEQASDGIFLADIERNLIDVNEIGCLMLGYTREELLKLSIGDIVDAADLQTAQARAADLASGKTIRAEHHMYRKDRTVFPVEISSKLLLGGIYQGIARDITERKQAEHKLRQSEERFRQAFDHAGVGMALMSVGGRLTQVNRSLCAIFGYSQTELLASRFQDLTHPDDLDTDLELMGQLLAGEIGFYHIEKRYFHKDGRIVWGALSATLVRNFNGEPLYFVGQLEDITQRKQAEVSVAFERYLLNSLMESTPDSIYFKDRDSKFTRINRALAESLSLADPQEAVGKSDADFFSEALASQSYNDEQEIIRTGTTILEKEEREVWPDGHETCFLTTKMPLWDTEGQIIGTFGVSRNVTDRMQVEAAMRNSESKYRALIEAMPDLMVQINRDGVILDFGAEKNDRLLMSPAQFIGKTLYDILPLEVAKLATQNAAQALESGRMQSFEYHLPVGGTKQDFEARIVVSGQNEVVAIIRNITERKQAQEVLLKVKADLELRVAERTAELRKTNKQLQHELSERTRAEHIAKESMERLAEAQSLAQIGSWEWTAQDNEVIWSDELFHMVGAKPQQFKPSTEAYLQYIHPDDRERMSKDVQRGRQESGSFSNEARFIHSDGTVRYFQARGETIQDADGKIIKIRGTRQDITDRKHAEQALYESEQRYRQMFQGSGSVKLLIDSTTRAIVDANPAASDFYGYSLEELKQLKITEIDVSIGEQESSRIANLSSGESANFVRQHTLSSGEIRDVEVDISLVDVGGHKLRYIIVHDITDRKLAEQLLARERQSLQQSETRYRAVVEDQTEIICRCLPDGTLTFVNEAFCQYRGQTREELMGTCFLESLPNEEGELMEKYLASFDRDHPTSRMEQRVVSSDGSVRRLHWTDRALFDDQGNIIEFQSVGSDVTALEMAREEAEAANKAKSEFLSRMSHELRTPLNAIIGFSQLLEMDELNTEQRESIELILRAGHHLLGLINEVLEISRIEAGRMSISTEPVSVVEVIEECIDLVRPMAAQTKLLVQVDTPDRAVQSNWYVLADRQRIKQVLLNLLSNAIKYNRVQGSVLLSYRELETGRMQIEVKDTGCGIPLEKMEKLFTPFERLGADQTRVEGTGLGLALSKNLAELMGGSISVESVVGQGSTFCLELPVAVEPLDPLQGEITGPVTKPQGSGDCKTLLYIEDNLSNLRLIEHILRGRPDIKLLSAMQGGLGFELATQHLPDLILLDLHLPDMHGEGVLEWLRGDPRTSEIPVVIVSADATPHEVERLLSLGASAYITKPIDVKQFLATIEHSLEGKELSNAR